MPKELTQQKLPPCVCRSNLIYMIWPTQLINPLQLAQLTGVGFRRARQCYTFRINSLLIENLNSRQREFLSCQGNVSGALRRKTSDFHSVSPWSLFKTFGNAPGLKVLNVSASQRCMIHIELTPFRLSSLQTRLPDTLQERKHISR